MALDFVRIVSCINTACLASATSVYAQASLPLQNNFTGFIEQPQERIPPCPICAEPLQTAHEILVFEDGELLRADKFADFGDGWLLKFHGATINSQEYNTDTEHMNSVIDFTASKFADSDPPQAMTLQCVISQPSGESFGFETGPFEVHTPAELSGRINYSEFRDAIELYYRSLVGLNGQAFRIGAQSRSIYLEDISIVQPASALVHATKERETGAW